MDRQPGLNAGDGAWPKPFKDAFCERFRCGPEEYEVALFWRCIPRHALPLVAWVLRRNPRFFSEDLDLIREVGGMTNPELFKNEINYYHGRNLRCKSWLRTTFKVRVSGKRLMRIKRKVFGERRTPRPDY